MVNPLKQSCSPTKRPQSEVSTLNLMQKPNVEIYYVEATLVDGDFYYTPAKLENLGQVL